MKKTLQNEAIKLKSPATFRGVFRLFRGDTLISSQKVCFPPTRHTKQTKNPKLRETPDILGVGQDGTLVGAHEGGSMRRLGAG